jgi:hypothetical protein
VPAAPSQLVSESDILLGYRGDAAYRSKSEQAKTIGQGDVGTKSDFGDGPAQGGGGGDGPPSIINPPTKDKSTELLTFDEYTGKPMTFADVATANKFLNFVKTKGGYETGASEEGDALYEAFQKATGRDTFMQDATVDSVTNMKTTETDGNLKQFMDRTSTITDNPTGKMMKSLVVETPTSFTQRTIRPTGIMENDVPQKFGDPQSLLVDPPKNIIGSELKDGGRVGLFMGGPALEGQALAIYNSMKDYGATDQAIADRLAALGLSNTPGGSTDTPGITPGQPLGYQGGNDQDTTFVDRQDYSFNPANYGPGEKLEINPAAIGMSFYEQPTVSEKITKKLGEFTPEELKGVKMSEIGNLKLSDEFSVPKQKNFFEKTIDAFTSMPAKVTSQFKTPTGIQPRGPAELGFMTKEIEGLPAGLTRDQIRAMYDNYGQFFGRQSNFASARVPGKVGELANMAIGAVAGVPILGPLLSNMKQGDRGLQSKYTVDNVGFGNTGARDEFGLATFDKKDGFLGLTGNTTRNYVDRMNERLGELDKFFSERIEGFDINNLDDATLSEMSKINNFYTKQIQAYKQRTAVEDINKRTQDAIQAQKIQDELAKAAAAKDRAAALAAIKKQGEMDYNPNIHGPVDYGKGSDGKQSFDSGMGFGINATTGGPVSNKTGKGRTDYSDGGLATMFTRRR